MQKRPKLQNHGDAKVFSEKFRFFGYGLVLGHHRTYQKRGNPAHTLARWYALAWVVDWLLIVPDGVKELVGVS